MNINGKSTKIPGYASEIFNGRGPRVHQPPPENRPSFLAWPKRGHTSIRTPPQHLEKLYENVRGQAGDTCGHRRGQAGWSSIITNITSPCLLVRSMKTLAGTSTAALPQHDRGRRTAWPPAEAIRRAGTDGGTVGDIRLAEQWTPGQHELYSTNVDVSRVDPHPLIAVTPV